jgi:hypothetical protein
MPLIDLFGGRRNPGTQMPVGHRILAWLETNVFREPPPAYRYQQPPSYEYANPDGPPVPAYTPREQGLFAAVADAIKSSETITNMNGGASVDLRTTAFPSSIEAAEARLGRATNNNALHSSSASVAATDHGQQAGVNERLGGYSVGDQAAVSFLALQSPQQYLQQRRQAREQQREARQRQKTLGRP